jgi:hypothetical protein
MIHTLFSCIFTVYCSVHCTVTVSSSGKLLTRSSDVTNLTNFIRKMESKLGGGGGKTTRTRLVLSVLFQGLSWKSRTNGHLTLGLLMEPWKKTLFILLGQVYPYKALRGCKKLLHLSWVTGHQKVGNVNKSGCRCGSTWLFSSSCRWGATNSWTRYVRHCDCKMMQRDSSVYCHSLMMVLIKKCIT